MLWHLGRAMHKKQEFDCARLIDFEFRLRARTLRLRTGELDLDAADLVGRIAESCDAPILASIAADTDRAIEDVEALYRRLQALARSRRMTERGDPKPHRLG